MKLRFELPTTAHGNGSINIGSAFVRIDKPLVLLTHFVQPIREIKTALEIDLLNM
jgi:hypothetical protein